MPYHGARHWRRLAGGLHPRRAAFALVLAAGLPAQEVKPKKVPKPKPQVEINFGRPMVIGQPLPVLGSPNVTEMLTKKFDEQFGATWAFEEDPIKAAHLMIDHIDGKRADLGLPGPMYDVPYAPKAESTAPKVEAEAGVGVG